MKNNLITVICILLIVVLFIGCSLFDVKTETSRIIATNENMQYKYQNEKGPFDEDHYKIGLRALQAIDEYLSENISLSNVNKILTNCHEEMDSLPNLSEDDPLYEGNEFVKAYVFLAYIDFTQQLDSFASKKYEDRNYLALSIGEPEIEYDFLTNLDKANFVGTWKSCGITTKEGNYYTVKQLENIGNYNITDIYQILNNTNASVYVQGQIYTNVKWETTADSVIIGTNVMKPNGDKLTWDCNDEIIWFEKITDINDVNEIKKNPCIGATFGEQNALKKAESYLSHMCFSYNGLIEQLEYEKFSHSEAVFAADNCGADWNEQAVGKAISYLSHTSFSKESLISQLEYEGFTHDQAIYAVEQVGYNN